MKLVIISDVHIDNHPWDLTTFDSIDDDVAAILIAGDISNNIRTTSNWLVSIRKQFSKVIWTPGNHDFYNSGFNQTRLYGDFEKEWPYPGNVTEIYDHYARWSKAHDIEFLDGNSTQIDNGDEKITIIGATGWHDFVSGGQYTTEQQVEAWSQYLNDARHINWGKPKDWHAVMAKAAKDAADINTLVKTTEGPLVVMTHHIPRREFAMQNPADMIWTQLNGSFVNGTNY